MVKLEVLEIDVCRETETAYCFNSVFRQNILLEDSKKDIFSAEHDNNTSIPEQDQEVHKFSQFYRQYSRCELFDKICQNDITFFLLL